MTDEISEILLTEPEAATDKLGSIIDKAIEATEKPEASVDETESQRIERERDEKGRFASKKDSAETAPKGTAAPATAEVKPEATQPVEIQPIEPPARLTEAQKAEFSKLAPEAQKIFADRYKEMEADYTRKTQETAEFRKTAEPLLNAALPFKDYFSQLGVTPDQAFSILVAKEKELRTGTAQQRYTAFAQLASDYGVDLAALSRGEVPQTDPQYLQLSQTIAQLSQGLNEIKSQAQQENEHRLKLEIDAFSKRTDDTGKPLFPHFERVRGVMSQYLQRGEAQTLEEAYSKAVEPINEAIAAELKTRTENVSKAQAEAVEKAKRAAPVKSSPSQPKGNVKGGSLDSIISQAMTNAGVV